MLDENCCELFGRNDQLIIIKGALVIAKEELKYGQYRLIRKTMVGEARVTSVMVESLTFYHRCLSMSKLRLEVLFDRILFELNTTNCFLAFTLERTTLKVAIEYF